MKEIVLGTLSFFKYSLKIKLTFFAFSMLLTISCYSQDYLVMFRNKALWGFMNLKGEVIIKPKYKYCRDFNSGIAKVGAKVFINLKGEKLLIKVPNYTLSREFNDGMLAIKVGMNWGFVNTLGELVIQTEYNDVTDFYDGYALAINKNETFVLDKNGKETKVITKDKIKSVHHFSEGMAPIQVGLKYGFVNEKGVIIIEPQFLSVGYFSNGLAWARTNNNKLGYIDTKGKWVIEPKFYATRIFDKKSGRTRVKDKSGWGYVNSKGEILRIKEAQVFNDFEDGLCALRVNNLWGFIDGDGKWAIEPKYTAVTSFTNGFAGVRVKEKWGVINQKGEMVLQPIYNYIKTFNKID